MDNESFIRVRNELGGISDEETLLQKLICLFESEVEDVQKMALAAAPTGGNVQGARNTLARNFWINVQFSLPHVDTRGFPKKLINHRLNQKRRELTRRGIRRGRARKVLWKESITANTECLRSFLIRGIFVRAIKPLRELQQELKDVIVSGGRRKKRHIYSLAKTVVTGGMYASRQHGIRGSIHWNVTLKSHSAMQPKVFAVLALILKEAFGMEPWYKHLLHHYGSNPYLKDILIPDTPCTSLCWSYGKDHPFSAHHNWGAYDIVFLLCPEEETETGMDVLFCNPECTVLKRMHLSMGKIIAGRWSQCKHSYKPLLKQFGGCSMMAYFDTRFTRQCYRHVYAEQILQKKSQESAA